MFVTGMNPLLGQGFMLLTLIISVPGRGALPQLAAHDLEGLDPPPQRRCSSRSGVVFVFGLGGLTGIFLGTISTDLYLHDTMFVVGHFHFTMAAASFLASFAALYFWFPKMFGPHDERDARQDPLLDLASSSSPWCSAGR